MVQILQASRLSLRDVEERFQLQETRNPQFFEEWQDDLPDVSSAEQQWLDNVREDLLSLAREDLHEEIVKLVVLSPLLSLAGLTRYPFVPQAEGQVEICFEDTEEMIRGKIDVLVVHRRLWVVVVEAKRHSLNVSEGLAQALFHMMLSPDNVKPTFGLVLNGTEFLFIKLVKQNPPQYGLSRLFSLINPGNDLYSVLGILKRLRETVLA
ncbi:restriction endonuclease subunit R [Phormidesmis priestleyi]